MKEPQNPGTEPRATKSPPPSIYRRILFTVLAFVLVLLLLEGAATAMLLAYDLIFWSLPVIDDDRQHTAFDPEFGWVTIPNMNAPDLFGPGFGVITNDRGFRNSTPTTDAVPPGRFRLVCTGDSFTFGYGVGNEHTWVFGLEAMDPRLEVLNLGSSGYGFDQAYLWYQRAGMSLEQQIHVFAFIAGDFDRMRYDRVFGYGKPRLRLVDGQLQTENVPVPQTIIRFPWMWNNAHILERVGLVRIARRVLRDQDKNPPLPLIPLAEMHQTVGKILQELSELHQQRGSRLVLMWLPTREDLDSNLPPANIHFLRRHAAAYDIPVVDVTAAARELPEDQRRALFGRPEAEAAGETIDDALASHFSTAGNRLTAQVLYRRLGELGLLPPNNLVTRR